MRLVITAGLLAIAATSMAGDLVLSTTTGKKLAPLKATGKKATVYFFLLSECPNANAYAPEINRIVARYSKLGVALSVVMVDPTLKATDAARHARDYGFKTPVLLDPGQRLAGPSKIRISPSVAVYDRAMKLAYTGRIDDLFYAPGKRRPSARVHDLTNALDAVLTGKRVPDAHTTAIGCILPTPER
jgi:hypothetical protein